MKHLLIIRLSAMGDVAISVPVITALCEQYPQLKITILTRKLFAPMFSHLPNCQIFTPDLKGKHKGFIGLFRLYRELQSLKIDAVADIHNVLRTNILKYFFKSKTIPWITIDKGRKQKKALTRAKNKIFKELKPTYIRYADVFTSLGFPISLEKNYFTPLPTLSEKVTSFISRNKKNIGIAPFAAHLGKQYPFENMVKVIKKLSENTNYQIFIFGGGEKEKQIIDTISNLPNVSNIIGKLSFSEELELISRLEVMLAMDSGNAHLSAMYGVPTITIWGVTHPFSGFYPYKQPQENALVADRNRFPLIPTSIYGNKYPKGYEKAIETIDQDDIVNKIKKIINN